MPALDASVTPAQVSQLNAFVQGGGDLDALLALAHLADPAMRPLSRLAILHSRDYADNHLPHCVIFALNPRAKSEFDRTDIRLVSGKASLALEAGTVSGVA